MEFYRIEPTPRTSWRIAVLLGSNTRTYKFALGQALLTLARQGHDSVTLDELAVPYALALAEHSLSGAQSSQVGGPLGERDYLSVLAEESVETVEGGVPTDRLIEESVKSMPGMVMQKFHNRRGLPDGVPHRFYEISGRGSHRKVLLTDALREVVAPESSHVLEAELQSRWGIVEASFDSNISRGLLVAGAMPSDDLQMIVDPIRRAPVAQSRSSLVGFQHGRCFYCGEPILSLENEVHVDHVVPFSLMRRKRTSGPDLNGVWNLVVTHAACNLAKSDRIPDATELERLFQRNEVIVMSPHPLSKAITNMTGKTREQRLKFLPQVMDFFLGEPVVQILQEQDRGIDQARDR